MRFFFIGFFVVVGGIYFALKHTLIGWYNMVCHIIILWTSDMKACCSEHMLAILAAILNMQMCLINIFS